MAQLIIPTQEDIDNLSNSVVLISEMQEMSCSEIQNEDVYTFARIDSSLISSNYNIEYSDFTSTTHRYLLSDNLNISGDWMFGEKDGSSLKIETSAITTHSGNEKVVVNKEYFEKNILSKIDELSSFIYNDPHIPSHVGELIVSFTLSNAEMVSSIYPGQWEMISNVMILGEGTQVPNTIETRYGELTTLSTFKIRQTGGEKSVKLKTSDILAHLHKFKGKPVDFNMSWEYHGNSRARIAAINTIQGKDRGSNGSQLYKKAKKTSAGGSIKIKGEKDITTSKIYKQGSLNFSTVIYNSNGIAQSQTSHNNIPPVVFVYVWRRIG